MSLFNNLADFRFAMQVNPDVMVLMDIIFHESSQDGIEMMKEIQQRRGVEVCLWRKEFPEVQPASIVIEAFSCKLPDSYVAAMAELQHPPVWINLEYLSADAWVHGCHGR